MSTLYDFGYLCGRGDRIINDLIAVRTPLVDVRLSPTSKHYKFTQDAIRQRDNIIYHHVPDLGNDLYKEARRVPGRIRLHNPEAGLAILEQILDEHGRAAIFCACPNKTTCHRILVAEMACKQFGVKVVHL